MKRYQQTKCILNVGSPCVYVRNKGMKMQVFIKIYNL